MRHTKYLIVLVVLLSLIQWTFAADGDIADHPGYVDFSTLFEITGTRPNVEVTLDTPLLTWIANLGNSRGDEEQSDRFISQLRRVSINVFENDQIEFDSMAAAMATLSEQLEADEWQHLLKVHDDNNYFSIYFRLSEDGSILYGSTILSAEPGEARFVNYVLELSMDDIGLFELASLLGREWLSEFHA